MSFLLVSTIRVSVILAAALLSTEVLRRKSASLRHGILCAAVIAAAIVPAASAFGPLWRAPSPIRPEALVLPTADPSATQSQIATAPIVTNDRSNWVIRLPFVLWLTGLLMSLLTVAIGSMRLFRLAAASRPMLEERWSALSSEIAEEYRLRRSAHILQSPNPSILVTWGFLKPKVLVPAGAEAWSEDRANAVLSHELAHIRRGDWMIHLTAEILCAIHWFNPLMRIVCKRLRIESEYACDDAALGRGIRGSDYASHLLDLARTLNTPETGWSAAIAMARPSTIERRFAAMLNPTLNRGPLTVRALIAIALVSVCLTIPIAILGTAAQQVVTAGLTGAVSDSTGAVVPSATVIVSTPDGRTEVTATTNANGRFGFTNLSAGTHVIQVFAQGFGSSRITNVELRAGQQAVQDVRMDIGFVSVEQARPAASRPIVDPNPRPVTQTQQQRNNSVVTGQGSVQGVVTDPTGAIIPNVDVKLSIPGSFTRATVTNELGLFSFKLVPDGTYRLSVFFVGFKSLNLDNVVVSGSSVWEQNIRLSVSPMAEEITVVSTATGTAACSPTPSLTSPLSSGVKGEMRAAGFGGPQVAGPQSTFTQLAATDGNPPRRIRQGGAVQMSMIVKMPKPIYPCEAKTAGIEGVVILEAVIGTDGKVIDRKLISGNGIFAAAVAAAVDEWQYTPALLNGEPVEVVTSITANFVLMK